MRILVAGVRDRGRACLDALVAAGHEIVGVIVNPNTAATDRLMADAAQRLGCPVFDPATLDAAVLARLRALGPELTCLAGYSPIVKREFIDIAPRGALNLHGGRLPQFRGSSPMNWALIHGERDFTLSVIQVDLGVDTGDVLVERTFPIDENDTIAELHRTANVAFPEMLVEAVAQVASGRTNPRQQDAAQARYLPLRFPEDGMIVWELMSAAQVHNRIRALTRPYAGAFAVFKGARVRLLKSKLAKRVYLGEPGRVYLKNEHGLLVCAADRCLWITEAVLERDGSDLGAAMARYEKFTTLGDCILQTTAMFSGAQLA
jgi:methionyl-tRNA formyltransferase